LETTSAGGREDIGIQDMDAGKKSEEQDVRRTRGNTRRMQVARKAEEIGEGTKETAQARNQELDKALATAEINRREGTYRGGIMVEGLKEQLGGIM